MTCAIFSDIHGNLPAFEAALADAKAHGADMFLLLGDYASSFPWGNGVAEKIRGLENAVAIRGNGEGYLADLRGATNFPHEQFKPVYWAYRTLSAENLDFLTALPETATISDGGTDIHLSHSRGLIYRTPRIEAFHSINYRKIMARNPFSHEEYLARAKADLLARAADEIRAMPEGIYLFGHNHLQFHAEFEKRIFINPGSCGEPLDWNADAAYTLLSRAGGEWKITERRVAYDLDATAAALRASEFSGYAPVWSKIMEMELLSGKDFFGPFVWHLRETGQARGEPDFPVSNEIFAAAARTWDKEKIT